MAITTLLPSSRQFLVYNGKWIRKFQEEGQAYYAGGSETSGQQILGPPKKKDGRDFVKEMFKKAREHGAEAVDPSSMGKVTFKFHEIILAKFQITIVLVCFLYFYVTKLHLNPNWQTELC